MSEQDWQPTATVAVLRQRAEIMRQLREFFLQRDALEVETPTLSRAANTDPNIDSFMTKYEGPGPSGTGELYLHTSPEFPMKRLLAAGYGSMYQICKVFRDGEAGQFHNPEFTMLEWYRVELDLHGLMDEVEALVSGVLDRGQTFRRITFQQAFMETIGIDPLTASATELQRYSEQHGPGDVIGMDNDPDAWLDLLMDQVVIPSLGDEAIFVYDYPASQASLARLSETDNRVAERFELFVDGVELANGFHELTDQREQRRRFEADNLKRGHNGKKQFPLDEHFLHALNNGLPDCSGVALGIDRLVMLRAGLTHIQDVVAFPVYRA